MNSLHVQIWWAKKYTYPAERRDVIIDCLELDRKNSPLSPSSPNLRIKSGMIRHPFIKFNSTEARN